MLYYSGYIKRIGEVHKGDTVMDYMKLERERGITIGAATITFPWKKHRINLVDTPGHVDFTVEVERSVRVMDGTVAIFDAVAGVQAQSVTVWNQSERYKVPRIAFVNKMDREGATMEKTLKMMVDKLRSIPLPIQIPLSAGPSFNYVVDLLTMKVLSWDGVKGEQVIIQELSEFDSGLQELAKIHRMELINKLSDMDEEFLQIVIELGEDAVTESDIRNALRRVTIQMKGVPVLFGSSLQNKGVQQVLDAVIDFLPSPLDREKPQAIDEATGNSVSVVPSTTEQTCALAFKVVHDHNRGLIVYTRVYSGILRSNSQVYNPRMMELERAQRLLQVSADQMEDVEELRAGDIGAIVGLKNVRTGDTLLDFRMRSKPIKLKGIQNPPPVFFCILEANSEKDIPDLLKSLEVLKKEDPSFSFTITDDQQIQISGMGELHLEIIKDRLDNHFKMVSTMGRMQVSYKGSISCPVQNYIQDSFETRASVGGSIKVIQAGLEFSMEPTPTGSGNEIKFELDDQFEQSMDKVTLDRIKSALVEGFESAFQRGVPIGFPVTDVSVSVKSLDYTNDTDSPPVAFRNCIIKNFLSVAEEGQPIILEPVMNLEISLEEKYLGPVLSDLNRQRRAAIQEVGMNNNYHVISAIVPLKEMIGYATHLRSITHGNATFSLEFKDYDRVSSNEKDKIIKEFRGY
eukprot:gene4016-5019_t